jgi:hypothetical protein
MTTYLLIGLWTYLVVTVMRFDVYRKSSLINIVVGFVLMLLAYPLILLSTLAYHVFDLGKENTDEQL